MLRYAVFCSLAISMIKKLYPKVHRLLKSCYWTDAMSFLWNPSEVVRVIRSCGVAAFVIVLLNSVSMALLRFGTSRTVSILRDHRFCGPGLSQAYWSPLLMGSHVWWCGCRQRKQAQALQPQLQGKFNIKALPECCLILISLGTVYYHGTP